MTEAHVPAVAVPGRRRFLAGAAATSTALALPFGGHAAAPAAVTATGALRIQRLAWAGVRLQLPGSTLLIDPLIDEGFWGPALKDSMVPVDDVVGDAAVLVTHTHGDHFDRMAVASALANGGPLLHPEGSNPQPIPDTVRARAAPTWQPQLVDEFIATPVTAVDGYGDLQVSWVVYGGGRRIFHGGDTLWHGDWWRIGRQYGPFDVAFLPINGAQFGWRKPLSGQPGVLTPEQALAAATILGARRLVPMHYGIKGLAEYIEVDDPLGRLQAAARGRDVEIMAVPPGAWIDLAQE